MFYFDSSWLKPLGALISSIVAKLLINGKKKPMDENSSPASQSNTPSNTTGPIGTGDNATINIYQTLNNYNEKHFPEKKK